MWYSWPIHLVVVFNSGTCVRGGTHRLAWCGVGPVEEGVRFLACTAVSSADVLSGLPVTLPLGQTQMVTHGI